MSKHFLALVLAGSVIAQSWSPWDDPVVTTAITRTHYVCPCDPSTWIDWTTTMTSTSTPVIPASMTTTTWYYTNTTTTTPTTTSTTTTTPWTTTTPAATTTTIPRTTTTTTTTPGTTSTTTTTPWTTTTTTTTTTTATTSPTPAYYVVVSANNTEDYEQFIGYYLFDYFSSAPGNEGIANFFPGDAVLLGTVALDSNNNIHDVITGNFASVPPGSTGTEMYFKTASDTTADGYVLCTGAIDPVSSEFTISCNGLSVVKIGENGTLFMCSSAIYGSPVVLTTTTADPASG